MAADVHDRLCSAATFATFSLEMPNPSSLWLIQIPAGERALCLPAAAAGPVAY